jgi:hypothetical protein
MGNARLAWTPRHISLRKGVVQSKFMPGAPTVFVASKKREGRVPQLPAAPRISATLVLLKEAP